MDLVLDEGQSVRDLLGVVLALRVFFFLKKKEVKKNVISRKFRKNDYLQVLFEPEHLGLK